MQHTQNSDEKTILNLSLHRISFLSFNEKKILEKNIDSANELALMSIDDISLLIKRGINKAKWDGKDNLRMAKLAKMYCENLKITILHYSDEKYPELLRQIPDPPFLLFCRGNENILTEKSVSVVGTRRLSQNGKNKSYEFAYEAAMDGCNVVSGLANGVDGFAHRGAVAAYFDALESKKETEKVGRTIAVLPSAIDEIVPSGHKLLAEQILKTGGCIISEYEPKMNIANWHFVGRNRIIAGLSPATVVIEAPAGSGALITADFAVEYNRELMFHSAAFGEMAKKVAKEVENQLKSDFAEGKVSKYKMENKSEKYLEAGAPIINNYKEYCVCLADEPGKHSIQEQQLLFED